MPTTFSWFYLGTSTTQLDPTEGNTVAENASTFVGQSYGSSGDPLYGHLTSATLIDNGGTAGVMDMNNSVSNDQFTTNFGAGTQTFTFDGVIIYNAVVTYANGTTANVTAVIAQSTTGQLFLVPDRTGNPVPDTVAYEAFPIVSVRLTGIENGTTSYSGMSADRILTGFDDGHIEGTSGNDLINASYVEPIANGTDRIDNGDGVSGSATGWQDDRVRAGAGNDTVLSGLGDDWVDGGTGADSIDGGAGNDTLLGGAGVFSDTIRGGSGNDSIDGGEGNDSLFGDDGNDTIQGGDGADSIDGGNGTDSIEGGAGNDTLLGGTGTFADTIRGGTGNDSIDGGNGDDVLYGDDGNDTVIGGNGNDRIDGGNGNDTLTGGTGNDTIAVGAGDTASGGNDADLFVLDFSQTSSTGSVTFNIDGGTSGVDVDTLDLTGHGDFTLVRSVDADGDSTSGTATYQNGRIVNFVEIENLVVCFAEGTLIRAVDGYRAVDRLRVGDVLETLGSGPQAIRWIGARTLGADVLAAHPKLRPIRIRAGALGEGMPSRDLLVSPQHRILLRSAIAIRMFDAAEIFVPAKHLLGLDGVAVAQDMAEVTYYHLLCDHHEIVDAEGAFAETLHTGPEAMKALTPDAVEEIALIFGGLPQFGQDLARFTPRPYQARNLVARHIKNRRAVYI